MTRVTFLEIGKVIVLNLTSPGGRGGNSFADGVTRHIVASLETSGGVHRYRPSLGSYHGRAYCWSRGPYPLDQVATWSSG